MSSYALLVQPKKKQGQTSHLDISYWSLSLILSFPLSSIMSHYLPPPLLAFFQPLPPAPFKPPIEKRKMPPYSGIAQYIHRFKDPVPEPVVNKTPKQVKVTYTTQMQYMMD